MVVVVVVGPELCRHDIGLFGYNVVSNLTRLEYAISVPLIAV